MTIEQVIEKYHLKYFRGKIWCQLGIHTGMIIVERDDINFIYFCTNTLPGVDKQTIIDQTGYLHNYYIMLNRNGEFPCYESLELSDTPFEEQSNNIDEYDGFLQRRRSLENLINTNISVKIAPVKKEKSKVKIIIEDIADCFDCQIDEIEIEGYKKDENKTVG